MKIGRRLKAAAANLLASPKAESFPAGGKLIECRHCENILFHKRRASLNTAVSSLTSTEWIDREACALVCSNCSRIEWFLDDLEPEASNP